MTPASQPANHPVGSRQGVAGAAISRVGVPPGPVAAQPATDAGQPAASPADLAVPVTEGPPRPAGRARRGGRAVAYAGTVALLVALNFVLPRVMPGDPIAAMLARAGAGGGQATMPDEAARASLEAYYGLDESLPVQFAGYVSGLVRGDLGVSIDHRRPVATLLAERLPWTLLLMGTATVVAVAVGMAAGVGSGWRAARRSGWGLLTALTVVRQVPPYFLAAMALLAFAATLGWVPLGGASTVFADLGPLGRVGDVARHLVLPASVLAVQLVATTFLFTRGAMVGELGAGYLLLGRAKGMPERRLKYRYAARNALLPVVSLTAMQLAFAVSGSIFIESVFAYPGVGRLLFDAIAARDYPVLQGGFLVLSLLVVTANYAADALSARLDPRVAA